MTSSKNGNMEVSGTQIPFHRIGLKKLANKHVNNLVCALYPDIPWAGGSTPPPPPTYVKPGAFKLGCRNIYWSIYLSKLPQKRSHQSIYQSNSQKKIILCFSFRTNINICKYNFKIFLNNFYNYNFECT